MSTTVHYFGKIKSLEFIREVQEEFRDIAQVSGWAHEMVDHSFLQEGGPTSVRVYLKGIRMTLGKGSSPLQVTFDKDGYLSHIYNDKADPETAKRAAGQSSRTLVHQIHTSTTLRAVDPRTHVTLTRLLDHLKRRYVPDLEVIDSTGYWYSRDESALSPKRLELVKK